jgi:transposase
MSRNPISMRKIKEVLRLKFESGMSPRSIGRSCKVGRTTVQEYLQRASSAGLKWVDAKDLSEEELERRLFPGSVVSSGKTRDLPDWSEVHKERRKVGVTLQLLCEEYREKHPDGLNYSRFCELYHEYVKTLDVRMRQTHKAGEKMFVDYSGKRWEIVNPSTGEIIPVEIFVAVLGASNYAFAEATMTQSLHDWIGSHIRAFAFFQGVTTLIVPDNLKSGVQRACYYDPDINPTFAAFAEHYQTAVLPARPAKPRDKPKVEGGVLLVQRWILARLRHQRFFSLADLNGAIRQLLVNFNERPFKILWAC